MPVKLISSVSSTWFVLNKYNLLRDLCCAVTATVISNQIDTDCPHLADPNFLSLTKPSLTHDITGEYNTQVSSHSSEQKCQAPKDKIGSLRNQVKRNIKAQVHIINLKCLLGPCYSKCDLRTVGLRCP